MPRHRAGRDLFRAANDPQRFRGDSATRVVRERPRVRAVAAPRSSRLSAHPSAWAWIAAWMVSGLIRRVGSSGCTRQGFSNQWRTTGSTPEPARNLRRRPAPMDQLAPHPVMARTATGQLLPPSAALAARPIPVPAKLRATELGGLCRRTAPPQFPADRRGAASQQQADRPKARPAPMLSQNQATPPRRRGACIVCPSQHPMPSGLSRLDFTHA